MFHEAYQTQGTISTGISRRSAKVSSALASPQSYATAGFVVVTAVGVEDWIGRWDGMISQRLELKMVIKSDESNFRIPPSPQSTIHHLYVLKNEISTMLLPLHLHLHLTYHSLLRVCLSERGESSSPNPSSILCRCCSRGQSMSARFWHMYWYNQMLSIAIPFLQRLWSFWRRCLLSRL